MSLHCTDKLFIVRRDCFHELRFIKSGDHVRNAIEPYLRDPVIGGLPPLTGELTGIACARVFCDEMRLYVAPYMARELRYARHNPTMRMIPIVVEFFEGHAVASFDYH